MGKSDHDLFCKLCASKHITGRCINGGGRSLIDIYTTARLAVFTTDNYYCMHRSHRVASRRIHETLGIVIHDAVDAARKKLGLSYLAIVYASE